VTDVELFVDCLHAGLEAVVRVGHKPTRKRSRGRR
jgi:hypothetical protein